MHTGNPVRPAVLEAAAAPFPDRRRAAARCSSSAAARGRGSCRTSCRRPMRRPRRLAARPPRHRPAGPRGGPRAGPRRPIALSASRPRSRPSSRTCRPASRRPISSSRRGGASTVAELAVIGRPSILVPLPGSLDQDQAANAASSPRPGGAKVVLQPRIHARQSRGRPDRHARRSSGPGAGRRGGRSGPGPRMPRSASRTSSSASPARIRPPVPSAAHIRYPRKRPGSTNPEPNHRHESAS